MPRHRRIVLLIGGPGAGKGTQARFLVRILGVPHVSSGDLLRDHRARGTELGSAAQDYMDRGDLVPDDLVTDMVMERLGRPDAARGALLDGFPRTASQARSLDENLAGRGEAVRAALYLDVSREILVQRLAGRWLCKTCQATYHERSPASPEGPTCSACGDQLYQRPDDRRDVVDNRVAVYLRETLPLVDHYAAHGTLHRIDGTRSVEEVRILICSALGGVVRGQRRDRWHLFIDHEASEPAAEGTASRWLGKTLCGKYVDRLNGREAGSPETFGANPCRRCWRVLRPHQGPGP